MDRIDELWEIAGIGLNRQDAAKITGIAQHVIYDHVPKEKWEGLRDSWQKITPQTRPKCFSEKDWREWNFWADLCQTNRYGFCEDCTPEYAEEMRACGKCERPFITFVDGEACTRGDYENTNRV